VASVCGAARAADTSWYWSEYSIAHALYLNGIHWSNGDDRMRQTHCWGLGHWLVDTGGQRRFSHFYCTATPTTGSQYDVIVNVTGPSVYAVAFASYAQPQQTWFWPAQLTANALYKNGVRWANTTDPVVSDSCSPFGEQLSKSGYVYYKHFYCSVRSSARSQYTVVVTVTGKLAYAVHWVAFDDQLPATPTAPRPVVAQTATSSGSSSSGTPDPFDPIAIATAKSAPMDQRTRDQIGKMLAEQAMTRDTIIQNQHRFGSSSVPNSNDYQNDAVGCTNDPYSGNRSYTTVASCGG
jgi:hypothetical protein